MSCYCIASAEGQITLRTALISSWEKLSSEPKLNTYIQVVQWACCYGMDYLFCERNTVHCCKEFCCTHDETTVPEEKKKVIIFVLLLLYFHIPKDLENTQRETEFPPSKAHITKQMIDFEGLRSPPQK